MNEIGDTGVLTLFSSLSNIPKLSSLSLKLSYNSTFKNAEHIFKQYLKHVKDITFPLLGIFKTPFF